MSNKGVSIYADALKQHKASTPDLTPKDARGRDKSRIDSRAPSREGPRQKERKNPRELPTRDQIQEFSFRLRDEIKVKMQTEVPYEWKIELEQMAFELNVGKLELYRMIIGRFLGKTS